MTAILGFLLTVFLFRRHLDGGGYLNQRKAKRDPLLLAASVVFENINQNSNNIGIIIIGIFLSAKDVGTYGVAMRSLPFLMVPLVAYNAIFAPIISGLYGMGQMKDLEGIYKSGSKWVMTVSLPLYALMIFFSDHIIRLFGAAFGESAEIMVILLSGQLIIVISGSAGFVLSMTGRTLFNLFNSACLCILNFALSVMLVRIIGISGAAYAYVTSICFLQVLQIGQVWYLYRILPYSLEHMKPAVACLISYFVILLLRNSTCEAGVFQFVVIITVLFLSVYFILLLILGLSPEDRMLLKSLRERIFVVLLVTINLKLQTCKAKNAFKETLLFN